MFPLPYEDMTENALFERDVDLVRNSKTYAFSALVQNGGAQTLRVRIPAGSSFLLQGVLGRAMGPVDATGRRQGVTNFPMAGSAAVGPGQPVADRGIVFRVSLANGRSLTNEKKHFNLDPNVVAAASFTGAGYGQEESFLPLPYRLLLSEGDVLLLEIENRDLGGVGEEVVYHKFDLLLIGERYVR